MPDPSPHEPQLVAYSRDRTLWARAGAEGPEVIKVYEQGSAADAHAEAERGKRLAAIPGLVRHLGSGQDPETHKPFVRLEHHRGTDLSRWLAARGPLPARSAAAVAAAIAETAAAMHAHRDAAFPQGIVHRDLKPSNALLCGGDPLDPAVADVVVLDLEHATGIGGTQTPGFSGGTHGFAPPEAYAGAPPTAAFDSFGVGATLHALLTGRPPFEASGHHPDDWAAAVRDGCRRRPATDGLPAALRALLDRCLDPDPERRPPCGALAEQLRQLAGEHSPLDRVHAAILRGDLAEAERAAAAASGDGDETERNIELNTMVRRRQRLLAAVDTPDTDTPPEGIAERLGWVLSTHARVDAWLRRMPGSPRLLQQRARVEDELEELLGRIPEQVARHKYAAEFDTAEALLLATGQAALRVQAPRAPRAGTAQPPGPMQRDPLRYLDAAQRDVQDAARTHGVLLERLRGAEAAFDLGEAASVLDSAASLYSGANEVVAGLKDRIHQLGFYLERIAAGEAALPRLEEHLALAGIDVDLQPLRALQERCQRASATPDEDRLVPAHKAPTLRSLRSAVHDLLAQFPHIGESAASALATLDHAFAALTDWCWDQLADGQRKLDLVPIPIRPLSGIINRVDTLRLAEVLVDRPDRSRTQLLDEHELLRLKVDQARTTRDRLARGAEEAFERGHLTTALYEMERAVDQYGGETGELERDGQRLAEQLAAARERKQAIEEAAARSMQLAAKVAALDDADASPRERLEVLAERRQVLVFLTQNLQRERVAPYEADLHQVDAQILAARAAEAEERWPACTDARARQALARESVAAFDHQRRSVELPESLQRDLHRWEQRLREASAELGDEERAAERSIRRRRLVWVAIAIVVLGVVVAVVLAAQ